MYAMGYVRCEVKPSSGSCGRSASAIVKGRAASGFFDCAQNDIRFGDVVMVAGRVAPSMTVKLS
jgi:hypothetical protein